MDRLTFTVTERPDDSMDRLTYTVTERSEDSMDRLTFTELRGLKISWIS